MGYLVTIVPNHLHVSSFDGPYLEWQTCRHRAGGYAMLSAAGLYAAGVHYGWTVGRATLQPFVGVSYVDHPVHELPLRTQFDLGARLLVKFETMICELRYNHMSNAGLRQPNIGIDVIGLGCGLEF